MDTNGNAPVTKADLDNFATVAAQEFSQLRQEIGARLESIDRRLDRLSDACVAMQQGLAATQQQLAAMNRWADRLDRDNTEIRSTQLAQQKAIDEMAARFTRLEGRSGH